jgi:hypothetical protein
VESYLKEMDRETRPGDEVGLENNDPIVNYSK